MDTFIQYFVFFSYAFGNLGVSFFTDSSGTFTFCKIVFTVNTGFDPTF